MVRGTTSRLGRMARGFTLAEALIACVLLTTAITAITWPFTATAQNETDDARRAMAVNLAQEMMDEILNLPYQDPNGSVTPGPDSGETTRSRFDNMDDYDGFGEADGNVRTLDGEIESDPLAKGLSRSVSATYPASMPGFLRITVTVKFHGQPLVTLTRLAYNLQ